MKLRIEGDEGYWYWRR